MNKFVLMLFCSSLMIGSTQQRPIKNNKKKWRDSVELNISYEDLRKLVLNKTVFNNSTNAQQNPK